MLVPFQSEKRPKGTPVYRDPENPFNTWSGYGKRPVWLQERLSDGYLLDEMKLPHKDEGEQSSRRCLMDAGHLVVNILSREGRDYYRLDSLWGDAPTLKFQDPDE